MKQFYLLGAALLVGASALASPASHLYVIGSEPMGAGWYPNAGNECQQTSDGVFTYTVTADDSNAGTIYFGFASGLASNSTDWETLKNYRYYPAQNGTAVSFSSSHVMLTADETPSTDNSWKIDMTAGHTYTFTIDTNSNRFTARSSGEEGGGDEGGVSGIQPTGTLPVLYINIYQTDINDEMIYELDNSVIDKDLADKNYRPGTYYLTVPEGSDFKAVGSADEPLPLEMKARGNYTRIAFAKKPFKIKLGKKQNLLGLTPDKSKHYAILAHADDSFGYLRNFTGFNLGNRIQLPWTPGQEPVEVVINGDYRGVYFLTESIRVGDGRVNITEIADNETNANLLSGGYLIEMDNYKDDPNTIVIAEDSLDDTVYITPNTPEEYSDVSKKFITDQFTTMHQLVKGGSDNLWSYLDLDDAARYYIVEELLGHTESFHGSTYLYRDYGTDQKWHYSPLWDFGNAFNAWDNTWLFDCDNYGNTWIPDMVQNQKFMNKVKETWKWFMQNEYDGLIEDIDAYVNSLKTAANRDYERWAGKPKPNNGQDVCDNRDMTSKRNNVVDYLNRRIQWLKGQWGDYTVGTYSEPERDTTPAAALPDYVMPDYSAVQDLVVPQGEATEYYDLYGRRLNNPIPGTIMIVRRGSAYTKETVR